MSADSTGWFYGDGGWLVRHLEMFERTDWPDDPGSPFFAAWLKTFVQLAVARDVADEASDRLAKAPPRFRDEHLPALLRLCGEIGRERGAAPLKSAPVDCPDCPGDGIAVRFLPDDILPCGYRRVTFLCSCPAGREIGLRFDRTDPALRRRMGDILAPANRHLRLGPVAWSDRPDNRWRYASPSWDEAAGRPKPVKPWQREAPGAASRKGPAAPPSRHPLPPALTTAQELFLAYLGPGRRPLLGALSDADRATVLGRFAESFDAGRAAKAAEWMASRPTPQPEPQSCP